MMRNAATASERAAAVREVERVQASWCPLRADAFRRARAILGPALDRFLYDGVAPGHMILSEKPKTAEQHLGAEKGCR